MRRYDWDTVRRWMVHETFPPVEDKDVVEIEIDQIGSIKNKMVFMK
jgi:hypothetical protein